jgi:hypothetical protein
MLGCRFESGWWIARSTPHVPVWDKSARHDGTFSPADFVSVIDDVPLIDVAGAGVRPRHLCNTARIPTRCVQGRNLHPALAR